MKITKIECFVLLVPSYRADACSSAQDDLVVKIHTDEGLVGIGETDTNPWVARAMIEAPGTHIMGLGLSEMLVGRDPTVLGARTNGVEHRERDARELDRVGRVHRDLVRPHRVVVAARVVQTRAELRVRADEGFVFLVGRGHNLAAELLPQAPD